MIPLHEKINNNCTNTFLSALPNIEIVPPDPNKPTFSLNINTKTPEQIWYNTDYPFTMDRDDLLMDSNKPRYNIPRPPNSFILYAKNEGNKPKYKNMQANKKFRIIGKLWQNESEKVKNLFDCGAKVAKKKHANQHEGYQFRKRNQKKGVKKSKLSTSPPTSLEQHPPQLQYTTSDTHNPMLDQYNFSPTTISSNFISLSPNFISTTNCDQHETSISSIFESFSAPSTLNCPYIQPESVYDLSEYTNYDQIETSNSSNLESFSTPFTSNHNLTSTVYDLPGYLNCDQIETSEPFNFSIYSTNCDLSESSILSNLEFFSSPTTLNYPYIQLDTVAYNLSGLVMNESFIVP
ncbi:hypothetical protein RclHR1_01560005 [Rhizophagus clarus]|uniref:Mating-type HMG-box protein MAT1-2 n=1 Tax=Rhizophagus clarus TaxID=94130 RepID=A0A2Z6QT27_9GLOM|nr:hypothetical protein RclHR1_01560005 [Rhizophagus clarus]GES72892.1 mating-type HMG-box protein MAT1-2 [Rhizophagus clarus]